MVYVLFAFSDEKIVDEISKINLIAYRCAWKVVDTWLTMFNDSLLEVT